MEARKNNSNGAERRSCAFELRSTQTEDGKRQVRGHGAVYDSRSEDLGGFREIIAKGAFDKAVNDDIRALFNHDPNQILGRTTAGTLKVSTDERGLAYELVLPDTSYAKDLAVNLDLGNITQSSFAMTVKRDRWEEEEDGTILRTILEVENLYDVSPVTYPAYQEADVRVARRSLDAFRQQLQEEVKTSPAASRQRQLIININEAGLPATKFDTNG